MRTLWKERRFASVSLFSWILSEQETEFAKIVESNDGVPAVLTNFRGCRKSTVCKRYEAHAWLIGRKCVYISHDPEKHLSPIELLSQVVQSNASSIISVFSSAATLVARKHPLLAATAAVILGLFAPERVRHGVAIFDDITSKAMYKDATAGYKGAAPPPQVQEEDFPPPTVDEIERAVERYGEWWGRSIRFWILPFNNNDAGFHERMRSAQLAPEDIGKLAAELDLMCASGPAPLIGSPPIDVSEFNEAFALTKGKGLLEDAVRDLYGNKRYVDVNHFPRRLLHSVMYSLVTTEPVASFAETLAVKLAEVTKRNAVPLTPFRCRSAHASGTGMARENKKTFIEWLTGKGNPSLSQAREEPIRLSDRRKRERKTIELER